MYTTVDEEDLPLRRPKPGGLLLDSRVQPWRSTVDLAKRAYIPGPHKKTVPVARDGLILSEADTFPNKRTASLLASCKHSSIGLKYWSRSESPRHVWQAWIPAWKSLTSPSARRLNQNWFWTREPNWSASAVTSIATFPEHMIKAHFGRFITEIYFICHHDCNLCSATGTPSRSGTRQWISCATHVTYALLILQSGGSSSPSHCISNHSMASQCSTLDGYAQNLMFRYVISLNLSASGWWIEMSDVDLQNTEDFRQEREDLNREIVDPHEIPKGL